MVILLEISALIACSLYSKNDLDIMLLSVLVISMADSVAVIVTLLTVV